MKDFLDLLKNAGATEKPGQAAGVRWPEDE
jgi:hypothetical protein